MSYLIDLLSGAVVPLIAVLIIFGIVKKAGARKTILIVVFTLYMAEMLDIVGIPYIQVLRWNPIFNWVPFSDLAKEEFSFWSIFQFAANIALFVPFGILLPVIWRSFRSFHTTTLAGLLMSVFIELAQLFSARVTALDDLIMNTLGALLGYLIAAGLFKKRWQRESAEENLTGRRDRTELLITVGLTAASVIFLKFSIGSYVYGLNLLG